jgi:antibiotic biosynthesis monooxygenase (ABM) superfamily enzyme
MYGTVARMRAKPGMESKLLAEFDSFKSMNVPGYVSSTVYRLDSGSNEYIMTVVFADKASYMKNADDPEQDKRYQAMMAALAAEPDWSDGEIIVHQA